MLNLWIVSVILSTIFWWTANMLMKKASTSYADNYLALVFQYIAMASIALSFWAVRALYQGEPFLPMLSLVERVMVLWVWVIWYAGIALLFKAYDRLCGWVALVIANLATFIMYFMNLALYPWQESFSIGKIIVALLFFAIIAQFLLDQGACPIDRKSIVNKAALYPLWTAVCWALYFVGNSYFIKSWMMSPIQSGMLTETMILVVAVIRYMIIRGWKTITAQQCMWKNRLLFMWIWLLNIVSVYLTYYGYLTIQANTVNVIRLFSIPVASIMCWIFLKDQLTKKQTLLLVGAFVMMILFLFV